MRLAKGYTIVMGRFVTQGGKMSEDSKTTLWGLIITVAIIVVRIALELAGAPEAINNIFGVAWLYLVFPVLFAMNIRARDEASPYKLLLKDVLFFAVYTRVMVMVTYMLAYLLRWTAPRFLLSRGGNVGDNVSIGMGLFIIPVRNALIWIIMATVIGMIIGSITLLLKRKAPASAAAA